MSDDAMTERTWGEDGAEGQKKKRAIPTWLWFCGGGCLLATVAAIVLVAWLFTEAKNWVDPEKQWPELAKVLPFDERPADLTLHLGSHLGFDMYVFDDRRGFAAILWQFGASQAEEVRSTLLNPAHSGGAFGYGARRDLQGGKLVVQGRELDVVRFHQLRHEEDGAKANIQVGPGKGPSILVDLTPEGETRPLVLQLVRLKSEDRITDEEVKTFLAPFHVGPER